QIFSKDLCATLTEQDDFTPLPIPGELDDTDITDDGGDLPPLPRPGELDDIDIEAELVIPDDAGQERTIARMLAMQILYEIDSTDHPRGEVMTNQFSNHSLQPFTREYTVNLVNGVLDNLDRLDMIIQTVAQEFPLDSVAIVDRNILRIAVCEHSFIGGMPVGIVVDEAVKLAVQFGSDVAPRFVNGVLGSIFSNDKRLKAMMAAELPDEDDDDEYDDDDEFDPEGEDA
ncbi:MAG: transcription antitermination factor NusB, partial [Chloroflexota bacterium]